jgi:serine/threonine protein kinase/DNA-binding beta-propeller fold protein YncE
MALDARIGSEIAAYRIERLVGRGGMGIVYQAVDLRLGRRVALKLLSADLADDDRFRDRFVRESRLAASLDHHNIVPIYAAGEVDGQLYVAMRYVEGTDLGALIAAQGPLDPTRAVDLISQVASALDAAHDHGLVHRDVKAANVLLPSEGGHAYLTDFGLAKQTMSGSAMTGTGLLVGTVDYLAPEVIEGHGADARADQYALACVLFECLTGTPPFRRPTEAATLWAHMQDAPPPLPANCADLTPPLRRALAKSPADRYPTCGAFLEDVRSRLPSQETETTGRPSARVLTLAGALLLGSIVVAVGVTAHLASTTRPSVRPPPPPNSLVAIDPQTGTQLGAPIPVGRTPSQVVVSGSWVWVSSVAARTLTLVDGRTRRVRRTIRLSATPTDIAAGAAGSVWVAEGLARQVVQIFPQPDRISVPVSLTGCCPGPSSIAVRKNVVWVGDSSGVWQIASATRTPRHAASGWPAAAAATTDSAGNAWFTDGWGQVVYVSHDAGFHERYAQFGQPSGITWGADAVWIALPYTDAVASYDNTGQPGPLIKVSGEPTAVAFGEGALWVGAARAGTITKIDPLTNRRNTITIGGRISAIAVGDGAVWAAIEAKSALQSGSGAVTYTNDAQQLVTTQLPDPRASATLADSVTVGMADWSPDGALVTYMNTRTGGITTNPSCKFQGCGSIHTMHADGTHSRQLTHPQRLSGDVAPRWSSDGTRIAAWRDYDYGHPLIAQLMIMDADGRNQQILRTQHYASGVTPQLDWSPDGSRLVIQTLLEGHPSLEIVNTAGLEERILTVNEAYAPRWSPDGTRIAYFSSVDGPGIYVTGVDGQVTHKLVATAIGSGTLTWSPDGRQLAFAYASDATTIKALSGDTTGWGGVFVVNADGSGLSKLVPGPAGFPDWVPHI